MFESTSWWEECKQSPNKLPNGISKEKSLLGNVLLFCSCVTNYPKFLSLKQYPCVTDYQLCNSWPGMVGLTAQGLRAGRTHASWRLWGGVTFLQTVSWGLSGLFWGCPHPCPRLSHLQPTGILWAFIFLQNLCLPPVLKVHVTRSN